MRFGVPWVRTWCALALALPAACAGGSHAALPNVPAANAPMGTIGPKLHLRIAHLGKPHYFYNRAAFNARGRVRHDAPYGGSLLYGGGPVETTPKVFLVFWGIASATDTTHDPYGAASYLTNFFEGMAKSQWLDTVTQYYGTYAGPTQYITNPATLLAGYYYDPALPPATTYADSDVANEALKAANLYGYDPNTNYIVVAPHGYVAAGSSGSNGFCAYHSAATAGSGQLLAYTNFPYVADDGYSCGQGAVNSPGTLDGVTIVSGHEEAEAITDANPPTGWIDARGYEIADKCAWYDMQNTAFSDGRSYPTQPLWSNASSSCVQSDNAVVNSGFETGHVKPWRTCRSGRKTPSAFATTQKPHAGKYDAYAGTIANHKEPAGMTSMCQSVTIPAGGQLTVWTRGVSDDKRTGVYQFGRLYTSAGSLAKTLFKFNANDQKWVERTADLSAYAGRQYVLAFGVQGKKNAHGRVIGLFVDDVSLAP